MSSTSLVQALRDVVGHRHVLTNIRRTRRYRQGFRAGSGEVLAVARPQTLVQLWRLLKILAANDVAIIMQAANTGLTGGSTPDDKIDRPVVIISTMAINRIHLIANGEQVVCLPGATLHKLEQVVASVGREPHSVIGSSCFGATVVGGVCNNSGGALVQRGPAYTELALFARIETDGALRLVNRLGIDLDHDPETALSRLELGQFIASEVPAAASDNEYRDHVRAVDQETPARFNADPRRLCDASGSAGKVVVFAVRLDTFPQEQAGATFYIGTNEPDEFSALRRRILSADADLPVSAEYVHRDAFDVADRYGRDTFAAIRFLGTRRLPRLFSLKAHIDGLGQSFGIEDLSDRGLQKLSKLLPDHLPSRLREWRNRFEHHLILTVNASSLEHTRLLLAQTFVGEGDFFECTAEEAAKAALHRFVTAGAAVRYRAVHRKITSDILALDVALPRNATEWFGPLPVSLEGQTIAVLRYGHFLCHVFHRDYILASDANAASIKAELIARLDAEGAEYPAEHNVGRQYPAKLDLAAFYQALDPTNRFNPGIGMTPTGSSWAMCNSQAETCND